MVAASSALTNDQCPFRVGPATAPASISPANNTQEQEVTMRNPLYLLLIVVFAAVPLVAHAQSAVITGQVVEPDTGAPVPGATVRVEGTDIEAITDATGEYRLEVDPGTYTLQISAGADYDQEIVEDVEVTADATVAREVRLARRGEAAAQFGEYTVQSGYIEGSPASVITTQREAPQVSDVIGIDQMEAVGDGDAAEALKRVTGLAVEDGRFVTIRGQPKRYTKTTLNGAPLPSPDPIRRIAPLDLFPTNILSEVSVSKSYDASQPGSFGGGLIDLRTQSAPEETFIEVSASTGGNTESTFDDGNDHEGGDTDLLGFDDDTREISSGLAGELDGVAGDQQRLEAGARAMPNIWQADEETLPPDVGLGISGGTNGEWLGGDLGIKGSLTWSQEYRNTDRLDRSFAVADQGLRLRDDQLEQRTDRDIDIGGFFALSLDWGAHRLTSNTFITRQTTQRTEITTGTRTVSDDLEIVDTLLDWNERELIGEQLIGEHEFDLLDLEWRAMFAEAERDNPDRRFFRRVRALGSDDPFLLSDREDATRRFVDTEDEVGSFGVDLSRRLLERERVTLDLSGGFSTFRQDRESSTRTLGLRPDAQELDLSAPVEEILAPDNLGNGVEVNDQTDQTDFFEGEADIDALYLKGDIGWADTLRVVLGVREETADFEVETLTGTDEPRVSGFDETDTLPSLSATWFFRDDMQARFAFGSTVSRPTLTEISETRFRDPDTDDEFEGNPDLKPAEIDAIDLRWEWFPSAGELVSVGFFAKDYDNPLEEEFISQGGTEDDLRRVVNADEADVLGVEITGRVNLPRITGAFGADWAWTERVFVQGNLSIIDSEVTLDDPGIATNKVRDLQGQADELFNLLVGYDGERHDVTAALNYTGERLNAVGTQGLPDVIEESRIQLDVGYGYRWNESLTLDFNVENLLDDEIERTQGGEALEGFEPGVDFTVGASYRF